MTDEIELFDCCVCGSDPFTEAIYCNDGSHGYHVCCLNRECRKSLDFYDSDMEKAKVKWNAANDTGHWRCQLDFDPKAYGFVYRIDTPDGKYYIGQKSMTYILKRPPLKGRKNKRHVRKETKWRTYCSSSPTIMEDIENNGEKAYKFEILKFTHSKFETTYMETKMQFDMDVLFDKNCLNGIINCRIGVVPKALQERFDRNGSL